MRQFYPLDEVIRKVGEPIKDPSSGQKLVAIDKKTGKFLKKSFFNQFSKDAEYYLVCSGTQANYEFIYSEKSGFSFTIESQVSCNIENAEKIAESLCLETHPGIKLEQKITKYIRDFIRKYREELLNNFPEAITKLENFIVTNVEKEIFLEIDVQISLDESKLKPYIIETQHFPILVKDCNEELHLELRAELIVDPKNKIKAISNYEKRKGLTEFVKELIKNYLHDNISLQKFYDELNFSVHDEISVDDKNFSVDKQSVHEQLKTRLNSDLKEQELGLKIRVLSINSNEIVPSKLSEIEENISYNLEGYPDKVVIKNRLQMILENVSQYKRAGSPPLAEWVRNQLSEIIPEELFSKNIDILFDFQKSEAYKNIKQTIQKEAKKIGYKVNQLSSIAELKFDSLTKDFILKDEGIFSIKSSSGKLEVKLNIIVTAKIEKLEKIKNHLTGEMSVEGFKELMKIKIHNICSQYLRKVEPERYYLRFDFEDDPSNSEDNPSNPKVTSKTTVEPKITVEQELKNIVKKCLETDFFATVSDIALERLDTEVSELNKALFKEHTEFKIEVKSKLDYGESVEFTGVLQVQGVDPNCWYVFQYRLPTIDKIKSFALGTLQQKLSEEYSTEDFLLEKNTSIEAKVNQWAKASIIEQYGLEVDIKNWQRLPTQGEKRLTELQEKMERAKTSEIETDLEILEMENSHRIKKANLAFNNKLETQQQLYGTRSVLETPDEQEVKNDIKDVEKEIDETSLENIEDKANQLFKVTKSRKQESREIREITNEDNNPQLSKTQQQNSLNSEEKN